jgi:hypothetical protein
LKKNKEVIMPGLNRKGPNGEGAMRVAGWGGVTLIIKGKPKMKYYKTGLIPSIRPGNGARLGPGFR